ncbi:hypothetical protein BDM02DRAFT_1796621 [Thelephora ganbajun]|uniref:Uncharacterized protein n=1 Tax=Thelephora ganbajun TaxID=370292 RepID=A0ACB6ZJA4_THEGA|nr:hypothetical protein BDM02DRAFT_1796621 [Thelephora ganbajun]
MGSPKSRIGSLCMGCINSNRSTFQRPNVLTRASLLVSSTRNTTRDLFESNIHGPDPLQFVYSATHHLTYEPSRSPLCGLIDLFLGLVGKCCIPG